MHKTHSHSKEGKHSASLLCFCMGFLFVIFHSQAKQRRRDQNKGETKTKVRPKQRINQNKGEIKPKAAYLACEVGRRSGSHARPDIGTDLPHTTTVSRFSEQLFWEHKNFQF